MSSHEARINDALKQLGEEFRLGMVQAAEYRSRRRALIESWGEIEATTSPGSLRVTAQNLPRAGGPAKPVAAPAPEKQLPIVPIIVVAAILVLAGVGYFFLAPKGPPAAGPGAMPPPEPLNPQVLATSKAADDFLAGNSWESEAIERFLQAWRPLSAADRAQANEQPSLRTLRYKLDQNIQAEAQLLAADAPPEQRQRLTQLEGFARELAGETQ